MITEILTGIFGAATMGYLWARQKHTTNSTIPIIVDKVSISKEALDGQNANKERH